MEKDAKIYVSGHRGMVGSAVVRALEKAGFSNLLLRTRAETDLLKQAEVESLFKEERPKYVIHCAAHAGGIGASTAHPTEFLYENLEIQNNVIWQAHLAGVKKLLFLSSSCVYPRESPQPMKEEYLLTGRLEPTNEGYAVAKIAGMKLCETIYTQYDETFISCMPTNIYGENDTFDPARSHVVGGLIKNMHDAKTKGLPDVSLWGTGRARRELLYVDDLADACLFLMEHYNGKDFLNVGTGKDISIFDLAHEIQKVVGYEGKLIFDTSKPDGMPQKLLDVSKLAAAGWTHTTELSEGLAKTYRHFLEKHPGA